MKLTTKLLLGATLVAGLSISAFAACAANVDFGGSKKLENLADGINPGDSVNYGQVLAISPAQDIAEINDTRLISHGHPSSSWNVEVRKIGNICHLTGLIQNVSGAEISGQWTHFGTLPEGYKPLKHIHPGSIGSALEGTYINASGEIFAGYSSFKANQYTGTGITYICQ